MVDVPTKVQFQGRSHQFNNFSVPVSSQEGVMLPKVSSVTSETLHDYSQIVYFRSSESLLLLDLFERSRTRLRIETRTLVLIRLVGSVFGGGRVHCLQVQSCELCRRGTVVMPRSFLE